MAFIGIISDEKREKNINEILKRYLEKENKVIFINKKNIDNMKNIKFETILILENDIQIKERNVLKQVEKNAKYLITNSDNEKNLFVLNNLNVNVITYGFNSKASVTASSVTDEEILLCVQRNIQKIDGEVIENQEIKVDLSKDNHTDLPNNIMGIATLLLIYGKKDVKI